MPKGHGELDDWLDLHDTIVLLFRHGREEQPPTGDTPGRKTGRKTEITQSYFVSESDAKRAAAVSLHIARVASRLEDVVALRQSLLDDQLLALDEARVFWGQIGPRHFDLGWFHEHGIPLLGHASYYFDQESECETTELTANTVIRFEWDGRTLDIPNAQSIRTAALQTKVKINAFDRLFFATRDSVFGYIQDTADTLARSCGWGRSWTINFLLTGAVPLIEPIAPSSTFVSYPGCHSARVQVTADFRSDPKTILQAFAQAQRHLLGKQRRPTREKQLRLLDFVEARSMTEFGQTSEELEEQGVKIPWGKLAEVWNRSNPKWKFRENRRMKESFLRTRAEVLRPPVMNRV